MTNILIIGHTGFIGSTLYNYLKGKEGVSVSFFDTRVSFDSADRLTHYLASNRFDYIYFLADVNGNSSWLKANSYHQFSLNVSLTISFINAVIASASLSKVIYLGSVWSMPLNIFSAAESDFINCCPSGPLRPYALSKKLTYDALSLAKAQHGLSFTYFITCTVAGPNDLSDHLIPTIYRKILSGERVVNIYSDGSEVRSFIHVLDLVRGLYSLRDASEDVLNLSSNNVHSILDVCHSIRDVVGDQVDFTFSSTPGSLLPTLSTALSESTYSWPSAFETMSLHAIIDDIFSPLVL